MSCCLSQVVQTIDGEAEVTIPPRAQPGQKLVLKGRGARVLDDPLGSRGDHVVTLRVRKQQSPGLTASWLFREAWLLLCCLMLVGLSTGADVFAPGL